jgi:hypothetical protein
MSISAASAQQAPLTRHFAAPSQERYQVTLTLRAESHSVSTETVAAQTYVTPVAHHGEITIEWQAERKIVSLDKNGTASIEENLSPPGHACKAIQQTPERIDLAMNQSLEHFCNRWLQTLAFQYTETNRGAINERTTNPIPPLGENPPPLLALWLRHAVRPSTILSPLNLSVGAKSQQSFHPTSPLLKNAQGSETTEWLDSQNEAPSATLHVFQQLSWTAPMSASDANEDQTKGANSLDEEFLADSLTTLLLQDGSILHASRTASRTSRRLIESIPGLPQPPDFSSKLTVSVTIDRLL